MMILIQSLRGTPKTRSSQWEHADSVHGCKVSGLGLYSVHRFRVWDPARKPSLQ